MFSMRWPVVSLIFRRELRDQLRDRRTLFMIFVLPILLYPMLVLGGAKLAESLDQRARKVVVVGAEFLPETPALLNEARNGFNPALFDVPQEADRYEVVAVDGGSGWDEPERRQKALTQGLADVVVMIPTDIRRRIRPRTGDRGGSLRVLQRGRAEPRHGPRRGGDPQELERTDRLGSG